MSSGAFLTSESGNHNRPSIFTLLAADGLSRTLQPALEHSLRVLAERYPDRCGIIWRFSAEIHLLIDFLLQRHYLEYHRASFSENFYGLQRKFCENSKRNNQIRTSLLTTVLLPYVKLKCDRMFEKMRSENPKSKLAKCFIAAYPYVHMTWEGVMTAFYLLYTVARSEFHSPWTYIINCKLDHADLTLGADISPEDNWVKRFGAQSVQGFASALTTGLQFGAFFLQFLDWWYANRPTGSSSYFHSLIPPPPSPQTNLTSSNVNDIFQCPICMQKAQNETLLPVSGIVFCYRCIVNYLRTGE